MPCSHYPSGQKYTHSHGMQSLSIWSEVRGEVGSVCISGGVGKKEASSHLHCRKSTDKPKTDRILIEQCKCVSQKDRGK
jgi:hypothetical protein